MIKEFIYKNTKLQYLQLDSNKEKNLVFLHGFSSEFNFFNQLIEEFKDEYNIYGLNMPAHGGSEEKKELMNFLEFVDIFHVWIKELDINNLYLIGHSMGGGIAMASIKELAPRIQKIALIGPMSRSGRVRMDEFEECFFPRNVEDWKKLVNLCYYKPDYILNNKDIVSRVEKYLRENKNKLDFVYDLGHKLPELVNMDAIDYGIKNAKMPVGLFIGAYDGIIDYKNIAEYYHSLNKDVIVYRFLQAGHSIWLEQYDEFVQKMREFL
ncbi:alpha/beta fold hydrolase [[Mycoplasma] gypis]|uniref:Alpha/beta hydrolase n=1 Tax=[Mycoplasma] gypis TaxID=92404 RepID=A0ABZ2RMP3_9BACT|nr:alpha/beta hydrolase [[Mycoplasma] gypis]MBN0919556.1 alpha/beta hydrolase [[Mycoplasma] gypis]